MLTAPTTRLLLGGFLLFVSAVLPTSARAQNPSAQAQARPVGSGISLAPARVELEMQPGTETTIVVDLDYHSSAENSQPVRIVASLNDWTMQKNGEVEFQKANTLPNSASSWLIYSPAETTVTLGKVHSIRVTIAVPTSSNSMEPRAWPQFAGRMAS